MRDYKRFENYVTRLTQDVYAQPPDDGHKDWAQTVVKTLCAIPQSINNVLDVGCGQGFCKPMFDQIGLAWTGVTIGEDYVVCKDAGLNVEKADMSFLPFEDDSFGLVFARHVLEHSPFPLITLMEWRRVCKGWMCIVVPAPDYWGYGGANHYSMMGVEPLKRLLARAGWKPIHESIFTTFDPAFSEYVENPYFTEKGGYGEQGSSVIVKTPLDVDVEYRLLCEPADEEVA